MTSGSDWAYVTELTTNFSTVTETHLAMDTVWGTTTNSVGLGISYAPGPARPGKCGEGPRVSLLAILDNGKYAGGGSPERLVLMVARPGGALESLYDAEFPVPDPGSGLHELTLSVKSCE